MVLEVEDERFRVEGAMIGTAGVVAVEDEKIFGFRGISCELLGKVFFTFSEADLWPETTDLESMGKSPLCIFCCLFPSPFGFVIFFSLFPFLSQRWCQLTQF